MSTAGAEQMSSNTFGLPWPTLNDGILYKDVVKSTNSATTLIQFYSSKYSSSAPLHGWLQRIRNGQIMVDGQVITDPETTLNVGSLLVYHRLPWEEPYAPHTLEILYEDEDIIALNKPSGLQVLPGGLFQQRTVLRQLEWRACSAITSQNTSMTLVSKEIHPSPVHRLGRGTSGILLCAKTKHAKSHLASYFADGTSAIREARKVDMDVVMTRKISKHYRALVMGVVEVDEVVIEQPIGVIHYPGVSRGLYVASSSGKPAMSIVKVLERNLEKAQTLVQVEIQSGRPHQIRIHLAFLGHPLVGDPLYVTGGTPKSFQPESEGHSFAEDGGYCKPVTPVPGDCGYYLHAHKLVFLHPSKHKTVEIIAPPPHMLRKQEVYEKASVLFFQLRMPIKQVGIHTMVKTRRQHSASKNQTGKGTSLMRKFFQVGAKDRV